MTRSPICLSACKAARLSPKESRFNVISPLLRPVTGQQPSRHLCVPPSKLARISRHTGKRSLHSSTSAKLATPVDIDDIESRTDTTFNLDTIERVTDQVDVCIIGGGPAGLSAAIRLKQLANEHGQDVRVVLLEKGGEVGEPLSPFTAPRAPGFSCLTKFDMAGSHILSGAVIETKALDELIPDWKELGAPLNQEATSDTMRWLTSTTSIPMPHPPQMNNKGNYIISLSNLSR